MDFVDWCDLALYKLNELSQSSPSAQTYGIDEWMLMEAAFGADTDSEHQHQAIFDVARELRKNGLISALDYNTQWVVTEAGRYHAGDRRRLWREICHTELAFPEEKQLLTLVNRSSHNAGTNLAWLDYVEQETLLANMPQLELYQFRTTAQRLVDLGLVDGEFTSGSTDLRATYRGLVWETRCVKSSIFVSYRRAPSEAYALLIAERLAPYGMKVFVDTLTVEGAEAFPDRLRKGIQDSDVLVCLLAPTTLDSDWVRLEIEYAHKLGKPMIPVFQPDFAPGDTSKLPGYLADLLQFEGIRITSGYINEALDKLAAMIEETWYKHYRATSA
jgi:TIR domain